MIIKQDSTDPLDIMKSITETNEDDGANKQYWERRIMAICEILASKNQRIRYLEQEANMYRKQLKHFGWSFEE